MIQRKMRNSNKKKKKKLNLEEICIYQKCQNRSDTTIELRRFDDCYLKQSEPPMGQSAGTQFKISKQKIPVNIYKYNISYDFFNGEI